MEFISYLSYIQLTMMFVLTQLVIIIALLIVKPLYKKMYIDLFIVGSCMALVGEVLILLQNKLPFMLGYSIGNVLDLAGSFIIGYSLVLMIDIKMRKQIFYSMYFVLVVTLMIFVYLYNMSSVRLIIMSLANIFVGLVIIKAYFRTYTQKHLKVLMVMTLCYMVHIVFQILNIVNAVMNYRNSIGLFNHTDLFKLSFLYTIIAIAVRAFIVLYYNIKNSVYFS